MNTSKKKNILIGGLLAVVVIMGIAYAAFSSSLSITGTGSTSSAWGVRITNIAPTSPSTNATCSNVSDPTTCTTTGNISASVTDELTATFSAALISPGDSVTYTVTVENYGDLDAKLESINMPTSSNPAISFANNGIAVNDVLDSGDTTTFTITVSYVNNGAGQSQPASTTSNFTLTLNFVQDDTVTPPTSSFNSTTGNGTIYSFQTEVWFDINNENPTDISTKSLGTDYVTNPTSLISSNGKHYYLKYTIENNLITESYICFVYNNTEHCMEGVDTTEFSNNTSIIQAYKTFSGLNNVVEPSESNLGCVFDNTNSDCYGGNFYRIVANSYGSINVTGSELDGCNVDYDGISYCWG